MDSSQFRTLSADDIIDYISKATIVPEKSLMKKKLTHRHMAKAKTIYPLHTCTSYTRGIKIPEELNTVFLHPR